jgi:hypothetical protein
VIVLMGVLSGALFSFSLAEVVRSSFRLRAAY